MGFRDTIFLQTQPNFTIDELKLIKSLYKRRTVKKNTLLVESGKICRKLFLIKTGVIRFFFTHHEKEFTWNLTTEGMFATVLSSFVNQIPSHDTLQTVSPSVIYEMSYEDNQRLINEMPNYADMYRILLERALMEQGQRLREQIAETGQERYEKLMNNRPELFQIIPQGILGSYLGMTRQSLSRLQKQAYLKNIGKL